MVDVSVFARKLLWRLSVFAKKQISLWHLAGLCRVLQKNVLGYNKAVTVRRTFMLLTHIFPKWSCLFLLLLEPLLHSIEKIRFSSFSKTSNIIIQ
jgi:hypothetical protein